MQPSSHHRCELRWKYQYIHTLRGSHINRYVRETFFSPFSNRRMVNEKSTIDGVSSSQMRWGKNEKSCKGLAGLWQTIICIMLAVKTSSCFPKEQNFAELLILYFFPVWQHFLVCNTLRKEKCFQLSWGKNMTMLADYETQSC